MNMFLPYISLHINFNSLVSLKQNVESINKIIHLQGTLSLCCYWTNAIMIHSMSVPKTKVFLARIALNRYKFFNFTPRNRTSIFIVLK